MNIKDHIEAGHYPKDDKGRALAPHKHNGTVTVLATDYLGNQIVGWLTRCGSASAPTIWKDDGSYLLPPPPRKVPVRIRIACTPEGFAIKHLAKVDGSGFKVGEVIEATFDHEEPLS